MRLRHPVPDLATLELLLSVARHGSLGAAAREHEITQQAASERIRRLETGLGVRLLDRSRRGSALTPAGTLVADWAGQLLDQAGRFADGIATLRQARDANLRVVASLTVAEYLLPAWLVELRRRAAREGRELAVQLVAANSEEVAERVLDGRADLGFVEGPRVPAGLVAVDVGADELVVVVDPSHPWARRRGPLTVAELAATPLVSREPGSGTRRALDVALASALPGVLRAAPLLELAGTAALRGAVLAGAGPAVLSSLAVRDDVAAGRLRVVGVEGLDLRRRLRAVRPLGAEPAGPVRDLLAVACGQ